MDGGEAGLDVSKGALAADWYPPGCLRVLFGHGFGVLLGVAQMPVLLLLIYVSAPGQFKLECVSVLGGSQCQLR